METTNKSNKFCGILFIILGVISVLVSEDNGCYDLTAALLLVPLGLAMIFNKAE